MGHRLNQQVETEQIEVEVVVTRKSYTPAWCRCVICHSPCSLETSDRRRLDSLFCVFENWYKAKPWESLCYACTPRLSEKNGFDPDLASERDYVETFLIEKLINHLLRAAKIRQKHNMSDEDVAEQQAKQSWFCLH